MLELHVRLYAVMVITVTLSGCHFSPFKKIGPASGKAVTQDDPSPPTEAGEEQKDSGATPIVSNPQLDALYVKVLSRKPDQSEIVKYAALAAQAETVGQVADALLHSSEYITGVLTRVTRLLLKRDPTNDELDFYTKALVTSGGPGYREMVATLLASPEFYDRAQSEKRLSDKDSNLAALAFEILFGRAPTVDEDRQFRLGVDNFGRRAVMLGLTLTSGFTDKLTGDSFQSYAGRPATSEELSQYSDRMRSQKVETVVGALLVDKAMPQ